MIPCQKNKKIKINISYLKDKISTKWIQQSKQVIQKKAINEGKSELYVIINILFSKSNHLIKMGNCCD
jgi:hypothetical protein